VAWSGATSKIPGWRALLLLHESGHPLFATTHRGDLHLTKGVPTFLEHYEQTTGSTKIARLIIDREGMAAEFLAALVAQGRTVSLSCIRISTMGFPPSPSWEPLCRYAATARGW
jgi:D-ribose pyranose/furanose isomerase RbsD